MSGFNGLNIINPLPEICKDNKAETTFYKEIKAIPYRGDYTRSSQMYLKVLYDLYELSPSFGAVINELVSTGFDGDIDLYQGKKLGLKSDPVELSDSDKDQFCESIETLEYSLFDVIKNTKKQIRHYKVSGNTYLHVRVSKFNNQQRVKEVVVDTRCCMIAEGGEDLIISKVFGERLSGFRRTAITEDDFQVVPIYPKVRRTKNFSETIFHLKNEDGQSEIYGMPESIQSTYWQFIEYSLGSLSAKVSAHEFVTKKIMQLPSVNPALLKSGDALVRKMLADFKKTIQELMTNQGSNPSSIAVLNMPLASEGEIKLHDIEVNRDTEWFKCQMETASTKIYELNRSYRQLTGAKDAKSSLGQDAILALDSRYYAKTVRPYQSMMSNHRMQVMNFIGEETGRDELKNKLFLFPNRSKELRDELEASTKVADETRS